MVSIARKVAIAPITNKPTFAIAALPATTAVIANVPEESMLGRIHVIYRIIQAVSIHVIAQHALSGRYIPIRVNKPSDGWVIVSALQIVEARLKILVISTVSDRIVLSQGVRIQAGNGQHIPPCVIGVFHDDRSVYASNLNDVSLQVLYEVVLRSVVNDGVYTARLC